MSLGRRAQVRLGNNFGERRAAAVVVHVAFFRGVRKSFVQIFRGVIFKMQSRDADALGLAVVLDFKPAARGQRQFVHRNLVALGQVRIKIIFSCEARKFLHVQMQRQRCADAQLNRALVQHGQSAGQAEAYRTRVRIRRIAKARRARTERLGQCLELHVDFETDDRLIARHDFGRDARDAVL